MIKVKKGTKMEDALLIAQVLTTTSGSYTDIGDISLEGAGKPVLKNPNYSIWEVEVPVWDEAEKEIVDKIKLSGTMPTGVVSPSGLRLSICMTDKPYVIREKGIVINEGVTKAGKPRFTFVNECSLLLSEEVLIEGTALMKAFAIAEGRIKEPETPKAK